MAVLAFTNPYVALSGTERSTYVRAVTLNVEVESLETTVGSSAGYRSHIGGLKEGTLEIEFNNDFADSAIDDIVWGLLGTVVSFEVRPVNTTVGTSNPRYSGSVLISSWTPVGQAVGELVTTSVSWPTSGTVTRAET
jgi:predicted secreted protein